MTRGELLLRIEYLLERLDVHDELSASELRAEFDRTEYQLGLVGLANFVAVLEQLVGPYETVNP